MFKITVEDAVKIGDFISVSGCCENKKNFTGRLTDGAGNSYEMYEPLGAELVIDESNITLCFKGDADVNSLRGKTLRSVLQ